VNTLHKGDDDDDDDDDDNYGYEDSDSNNQRGVKPEVTYTCNACFQDEGRGLLLLQAVSLPFLGAVRHEVFWIDGLKIMSKVTYKGKKQNKK
jgi:hypothetical protein